MLGSASESASGRTPSSEFYEPDSAFGTPASSWARTPSRGSSFSSSNPFFISGGGGVGVGSARGSGRLPAVVSGAVLSQPPLLMSPQQQQQQQQQGVLSVSPGGDGSGGGTVCEAARDGGLGSSPPQEVGLGSLQIVGEGAERCGRDRSRRSSDAGASGVTDMQPLLGDAPGRSD